MNNSQIARITEGISPIKRDTILSLISALLLPITSSTTIKLYDYFKSKDIPPAQAIEILDEVKTEIPEKATEIEKIQQKFKQQVSQTDYSQQPNATPQSASRGPSQRAVLVKSKKLADASKAPKISTREEILKKAAEHIPQFEIYGGTFDSKKSQELLSPYRDDNKDRLWTVGIGHLIGKGTLRDKLAWEQARRKAGKPVKLTEQEARAIFAKDLEKKYSLLTRVFGDQWNRFSDDLKVALLDVAFRGDLASKETGKLYKFVGMLQRGKFKDASKKYLDHEEYKRRLAEGGDSVTRRMQHNYKVMKNAEYIDQSQDSGNSDT